MSGGNLRLANALLRAPLTYKGAYIDTRKYGKFFFLYSFLPCLCRNGKHQETLDFH